MRSLDGDGEVAVSAYGHGEGVLLKVGAPQERGRAAGEAVVIEVALVLGDEVGSDDGEG